LQFIEDSSSDIVDKAFEFDGLTLLAEVSAALVVGVGGKEGAIGGEDSEGEKAKEADDLNQDLRDFDIEFFSQAIFEVSEIGFTGDMRRRDTGIEAIMFPLFFITDSREESFQIGELLQISEEFYKEEANRVIGMTTYGGIGFCDNGSHEREIDQGSDKAGESTGDLSGGIDLDPSGDKAVIGKEPAS
jgi:hypothetical protein